MLSDKKISPRDAALAVLKKAEELYKSSSLSKCGTFTKVHNKAKEEGYSEESADKIAGKTKAMEKTEKPLEKKYEGFKAVEESAAKSGASDPAAVAAAVGRKKYGKEAFQHAAAEGKKMKKDEDMGDQMGPSMTMSEENPDEKADAALGEKVEQEVQEHEENNEDPKHKTPVKGHIKLAEFMGAMKAKRGKRPGSEDIKKSGPMSEPIGYATAGKNMKAGQPNKELMGMSDIGASVRGEDGKINMPRAKKEAAASLQHQRSMSKPKLPG